ncbi:bL17 family ribosomal protein [Patescibacteria group bacterium]
MNHKKVGRKFGRVKKQREAMFNTLLGSLIMREKITTTEAKAKEAKSLIDRIVNKAKKATEKILIQSRQKYAITATKVPT